MSKLKLVLPVFFLSCSILMSGCETTKGVVVGVTEGVYKDSTNFWQNLLKADKWMKKNLW